MKDITDFPQTIEAALEQHGSMFRLAEALAVEVPRQAQGRKKGEDTSLVERYLQNAAIAVLEADGDDYAWTTFRAYRQTAFFVMGEDGAFNWIPKLSFSGHREAAESAGFSKDFAAFGAWVTRYRAENDNGNPTTTEIRAKVATLVTRKVTAAVEISYRAYTGSGISAVTEPVPGRIAAKLDGQLLPPKPQLEADLNAAIDTAVAKLLARYAAEAASKQPAESRAKAKVLAQIP